MTSTTRPQSGQPRHRRAVAVGLVAAGLTVAGTGAAVAAAPTSPSARAVADALDAVGVDWSGMPEGYTPEQYQAFWGAGYTTEDVAALNALWSTGDTETKARAGQMLLDGETVPVPPSDTPGDVDGGGTAATGDGPAVDAFFDAGYTYDDAVALGALWSTDVGETKARAGALLLEGQTLPVAPGSTPAAGTAQ